LNWQASGQRGSFAELIDPVELEVESLGLEFWSQDVVFEGLDKVFGHAIQEVDRSHIKDLGLATTMMVRKGPSPKSSSQRNIRAHQNDTSSNWAVRPGQIKCPSHDAVLCFDVVLLGRVFSFAVND
jgi:hypothetical protein